MMDTNIRLDHNNRVPNRVRSSASVPSPLGWWYKLTAPSERLVGDSLDKKELVRRGQLTSATLLVVILLVLAAYPTAFFGPNRILAVILLIPLSIDVVALVLNKAGKIAIAGVVVVVGIEVGIGLSILGPAASVGLTTYLLPQFDLLVQALFVAVTLLRPRSVLWLALLHCILIYLGITFLPHTSEFSQMLANNRYEVYLRPITLQLIVAIVTFLFVTGMQQALQRANRAEEIAALEQREIERQQSEIEQKLKLDTGIKLIMNTHTRVANGDFTARAPLDKDNALWQLAYSLNNLIARLQNIRGIQADNQMLQHQVSYLQQENEKLKMALNKSSR